MNFGLFVSPMVEILDSAPLAVEEGFVGRFNITPFVDTGKAECFPIHKETVDFFGIILVLKHCFAFKAHPANGKAVLFNAPESQGVIRYGSSGFIKDGIVAIKKLFT